MTRIDLPNLRLEVRDLRVVLALADAKTTARAAGRLHLSQPAVSRALLAVESKLGVALFARTPRGLEPTAAGARLIAEAGDVLLALSELEARVRAPAVGPTRLTLVCECYTAYHWLPSALASLKESMPGLELRVAVEHTGDPVGALSAGKVDVALLTTAAVRDEALAEQPLFADELMFLVAASHPLAARKSLTPADLCAHRLITSHAPAAEQRWFMHKVFGRARPKLTFERLPITEAVIDLTRAGLGIGVLSAWIAAPHLAHGNLVIKRLASGALQRPWRLAYRRALGESIARLHAALAATVPRAGLRTKF